MAGSSENSNLAVPAVLITVLAALGLGAPMLRSAPSPAPTNPATARSAPRQTKCYPHSALGQILDFFDRNEDEFDPDKPWSASGVGNVKLPQKRLSDANLKDKTVPSVANRGSPDEATPCEVPDLPTNDPSKSYKIEFLIATLPDPNSSPLRYKFDTYLDALNQAANTAGFNLFSFDLPWLDTAKEASDGFKLGQTIDLEGKAGLTAKSLELEIKPGDTKRSDTDPGVLLFNQRGGNSLLVVLIVGERPAAGINKATLRNALDQIAWLSGWRDGLPAYSNLNHVPPWLVNFAQPADKTHKTHPPIVYLMGPVYSTSTRSLNLTLDRWYDSLPRLSDKVPKLIAVSGTAGDTQVVSDWGFEPGQAGDKFANGLQLPPEKINYYSTSVHDQDLWKFLYCDLTEGFENTSPVSSRSDPCVANLKSLNDLLNLDRPTPYNILRTARAQPSIALLVPDNAPQVRLEIAHQLLFLPYPAHISEVRTAFGKIPSEPGALRPPLGRRDLTLADEPADHSPDAVPAFSTRAAMYDELSLSNLFSTIAREHIRYVGIAANDMEDLVFLVRQLRAWCPDVVVFTTVADLRFLHSDVNTDLDGMLVFSTYPLFGLNQLWTSYFFTRQDPSTWFNPFPRRLQFPSGEAEGIYNATLKLLSVSDTECASLKSDMLAYGALDYGAPFMYYGEVDYGEFVALNCNQVKNGTRRIRTPVLWLSVVGRDALWPVGFHFLKPLQGKPQYKFDINWIPYPFSFKIAEFVVMIICLIPSLIVLVGPDPIFDLPGSRRPQRYGRKLHKGISKLVPRLWRHILIGPSDGFNLGAQPAREGYVLVLLISLLLAYLIGLSFFLLPLISGWKLVGLDFASDIDKWESAVLGTSLVLQLITFVALCCAIVKTCSRALMRSVTLRSAVVKIFPRALPLFAKTSKRNLISPPTPVPGWKSIFTLILLGLSCWFIVQLYAKPEPIPLFDFVRASNLWNGVSLLHPLLFVGVAGLCFAFSDLRRLNLLEECAIQLPFLGFDRSTLSFLSVGERESEVVERLSFPPYQGALAVALGIVAGYFILLKPPWGKESIEGTAFVWFFDTLFVMMYVLLSLSLVQFTSIWLSLRKLLRVLYWHPSRTAYEELRRKTAPDRPEAQRITLFEPRPSLTAIEASVGFARELLQSAKCPGPTGLVRPGSLSARLARALPILGDCVCLAEENLTWALSCEVSGNPVHAILARRETQATIVPLAVIVTGIFEPLWRTIRHSPMPMPDKDEGELVKLANLFVATHVVDFLRQVFPQMLNLGVPSLVGALAMTLAVSGYPFPGHDTLLWFSWLVLLLVIATILAVFVDMNRDRVLSMLTGTTPGKLSWNSSFLFQLLIFGVIPILTLIGAQFPHALSGLLSWFSGFFAGNK